MEGGDNPAPAPRPQGAGEAAGYRGRVGGGGQVVGPDSQASPRPSSPAPNHSTSVMAFGVKWNEPGEASGGECAERRAAAPGSGAKSPRRRAGPGCGCGGCTPRREPPSSPSAPARTGRGRRGRRGRDGAVSHFPFQSKTHTHAPGRRLARSAAPRPRPRRAPPACGGGGAQGSPRARARAWREAPRTRTPPSPPPLPSIQLLAPEKRVVPARLATHRTTRASSLQQQGTRRRQQGSVPGQGRPWAHPRPRRDGRQSVSRDCGREDRGLHGGAGTSGSPRPPCSGGGRGRLLLLLRRRRRPSSPSPLGLGLSQGADGLRAVRFSCVTSSCSSSRSGGFTFPWSPPLSPLRAWSLCSGSLLAPAPTRAPGAKAAASRARGGGGGGLPRGPGAEQGGEGLRAAEAHRARCGEAAAPAAAETSFRSRGCPSSSIWRIRQTKKKKKKRLGQWRRR